MNEVFLDDLRERVHRGHEGQAHRGFWNGGRPYGYRLKPITDPNQRDAYGQPAQIGTKLEPDPAQAKIVRLMFERFVEGASCLTIARELNEQGVPSPGSTWKRRTRRATGWVAVSVGFSRTRCTPACSAGTSRCSFAIRKPRRSSGESARNPNGSSITTNRYASYRMSCSRPPSVERKIAPTRTRS